MEKFLTVAQAAAILGVHDRHIYYLLRKKHLTKYKSVGRTLLSRAEVEKLKTPTPVAS